MDDKTKQLLQEVLNYLATKPYAEVFQLITRIQQAAMEASQPKPETVPEVASPPITE